MTLQKFGRYEVKSELGRGGMATVYYAYDPRFERDVAIKVLPHALLHDPMFRARFDREAKTIAALEHPAIVPVYDFGEEDGQPYLVMRYMPGGSLEDRLQQGPLPLAEAVRIISRLAPGLDEAHAHQIIHRDLKPGNILFDQRGNPYLSDFGIVRLASATTSLTQGHVLGTPAYMSPEQGQGTSDIDRRSDIYSMGAILYQMLTGRLPYEASTPTGQIIMHITEPVPNVLEARPDLPVEVQAVIEKAMAKKKTDRYGMLSEMVVDLAEIAGGRATYSGLARPAATKPAQRPPSPTVDVEQTNARPLPPPAVKRPASPLLFIGGGFLAVLLLGLCVAAAFFVYSILVPRVQPTVVSQHTAVADLQVSLTVVVVSGPAHTSTPTPPLATGQPSRTPAASPTAPPPSATLPPPTATSLPTATPLPPTATLVPEPTATVPPALGIGSVQVSPRDDMLQVYVPAGDFMMGSADSDSNAEDNEKPYHKVYLDAFWIDQTEVTNAQYARCVADGKCAPPAQYNSNTHRSYYNDLAYTAYPVTWVTWFNASTYCQWAGRRLPTEAEWEKAGRGTDGRLFSWGNQEPTANLANVAEWLHDIMPANSFASGASPYGALNMTGNVWEWVADWFDPVYYVYGPYDNPLGPPSGERRVMRGGSWYSEIKLARLANRNEQLPAFKTFNTGIRCVADP
jgi:serine/threonine-protein kinase